MKTKPVKKRAKPQNTTDSPVPGKSRPVAKAKSKRPSYLEPKPWAAVGFDISMSSIAGAAFAYDRTLNRYVGPSTSMVRWDRGTHYFTRMEQAAKVDRLVHEMLGDLKLGPINAEDIYIALEEPFPFGMQKRMESNALKQQTQISGAVMGGLLRYGYTNLFEISNIWWRQIVAEALGITIHHTKWNPNGEGKFRAKQWVLEIHPEWNVPVFPDIIDSKDGKKPKPETSKAKPIQSDDRYEAIAIARWMVNEIQKGRD